MQKLFDIDGRNLRRKISILRQDGHPICSDESGYYYANTQREINNTVGRLSEMLTKVSQSRNGLLQSTLVDGGNSIHITITVG